MWINTNTGEVYKSPKEIETNGERHPEQIFKSSTTLASLGIKAYREVKVDARYYWQGQKTAIETEDEVVVTYKTIDRDIEQLKETRIAQVKLRTGNEILAKYPEWKQRNFIAEYTDLLEQKVAGTITPEGEAYMLTLKGYYADINAMRKASDDKEEVVKALVTIQDVIDYDKAQEVQDIGEES